jgi:hypothetical protein
LKYINLCGKKNVNKEDKILIMQSTIICYLLTKGFHERTQRTYNPGHSQIKLCPNVKKVRRKSTETLKQQVVMSRGSRTNVKIS